MVQFDKACEGNLHPSLPQGAGTLTIIEGIGVQSIWLLSPVQYTGTPAADARASHNSVYLTQFCGPVCLAGFDRILGEFQKFRDSPTLISDSVSFQNLWNPVLSEGSANAKITRLYHCV